MRPRSLLSLVLLSLGLAACGAKPTPSTTPDTPAATEAGQGSEAGGAAADGDPTEEGATQRSPKGLPPNDPCGGGE
ncbi:MAG: hypothetical protein R3B06_25480 [Kofleriaceae bacterium]